MKSELFIKGKQYFIRTVTYHAVGKVLGVNNGFVQLDKASWIADSGRLKNALHEGFEKQSNSEIEPFDTILNININSIVDFCEYKLPLPDKQK